MTRVLVTLALVLVLAPLARAQDMPLSQILIDGEGWKKAEKRGEPKGVSETPPFPKLPMIPGGPNMPFPRGTVWALSLDRGTAYVCSDKVKAITAYSLVAEDQLKTAAPYCPLRLPRGKSEIAVTGLVCDKDGRIYAATEIGVQVFDPTGRLCGVLTPAASGKPDRLVFEGDQLTMWIGDTKYTRKLNTTGAK